MGRTWILPHGTYASSRFGKSSKLIHACAGTDWSVDVSQPVLIVHWFVTFFGSLVLQVFFLAGGSSAPVSWQPRLAVTMCGFLRADFPISMYIFWMG